MMVAGSLGAGCFVVAVVSKAWEVEPVAAASRKSVNAIEMRRSNIYCTPVGLALSCRAAASEMADGESFGESGCVCMYLS